MAEINRIPDPVRPPQPVGGSFHKKPLRKRRKEEFEDILERKREEGEQEPDEEIGSGEDDERERRESGERGRLIDELA